MSRYQALKFYSVFLLSFVIICLFPGSTFVHKAWGASQKELVEGAKKEGKLVIYHSPTVRNYQKLIDSFHKRYPFLRVASYRAGSEKLLNKILAEVGAKKYIPDVIDIRGFEINVLKEKNLLMQYRPADYQTLNPEFNDPDGYYWPNCFAIRVIAYNTRMVPPEAVPQRYEDLLNPRWRHKLAMDVRDYEWFGNMLNIMGREKGLEFMKQLARQKILFRRGRTLLISLLAAGEFPIFLTASGHTVEQYKEQGAPIEWIAFDPIMTAIGSMGISAYAAHPHAAKLYLNYLASKEGQEKLSKYHGKTPVRPGAKQRFSKLDVSKRKLFHSSVTVDYSKFNRQFREMFMSRQ